MPTTTNFLERTRRALLGEPIPTSKAHHERLGPLIGLPVFSSDSLSSVAYATEAILSVLVLYSAAQVRSQLPITLCICALIVVIGISYQQTIRAYPSGGGSYIVASENLGETPGLIAGAALLIDYVLTVAVSIAAGVAAIVSAYPSLHSLLVPLSVVCIALVAWANLRGVRESGAIFALPTYGFIGGMLLLLGCGLFKQLSNPVHDAKIVAESAGTEARVLLGFLVLRAFAAGCTALTGIEAVSNGVQAFRAPESKNAITTLRTMIILLITMFLGIGYLAQHVPVLTLHATSNHEYTTVVSQIARFVFGKGSFLFYYIQYATAAILILAANTAFADFPRLSSLIARDGYLPRALSRQGDRLVFHNGIVVLAAAAILLVIKFMGELDQLLPLYAVGVFTAFTLSQSGMVVHALRLRQKGWQRSAAINGFGAVLTFLVTGIIFVTKFLEVAWIVLVLLTALFIGFKLIKRRYSKVNEELTIHGDPPEEPSGIRTLVLVPRVHRGIISALHYAKLMDPNCQAVHVTIDERSLPKVQRDWANYAGDTPLVVLSSPFRSLIRPVLEYVDTLLARDPDQIITVVVPEAVSGKFVHRLLTENVASQLKNALGSRPNVVVSNVRYFLD